MTACTPCLAHSVEVPGATANWPVACTAWDLAGHSRRIHVPCCLPRRRARPWPVLWASLRLRGVTLLDCQQETPHIMKMGGVLLPREVLMQRPGAAQRPPADAEPGVGLPSTDACHLRNAIHYRFDEQVWQPWRERRYHARLSSGAWGFQVVIPVRHEGQGQQHAHP